MKKSIYLFALLLLVALVLSLASCALPQGSSEAPDSAAPADSSSVDSSLTDDPAEKDGLVILDGGKSDYVVTFPMGATRKQDTGKIFANALTSLRSAFTAYGYNEQSRFPIKEDEGKKDPTNPPKYEILLGNTNRPESKIDDELALGDAIIRVIGNKIIIVGYDDKATASAIHRFISLYMSEEGGTKIVIPKDLDYKVTKDFAFCDDTGKKYIDMAMEVWDSFNDTYWQNTRWVKGTGWWDAAEVLETYIDAYEATGDKAIRNKMLQYAQSFTSRNKMDWMYNEYNDDITWAVIGFTRIYLLTGTESYLTIAKSNFDKMYARSWDEKLGGGLYWKNDNKTKNACINCPAAIAACLLAEATKDESYYDKAIEVMDWVFENLYMGNGGVMDSYDITGKKSDWVSTYNQGTFIGACNLLYQKTGDENYLNKATAAAECAMKNLTTNGVLNGEASLDNKDLPGFKGILTRWLYRFAKDTNNKEILVFLQTNAATAYSNQNSEGLIWTAWNNKTPENMTEEDGYCVFGMSTAVALMFNSLPWD